MSVARDARWEHFSHGSDIGLRGRGPTREAAFAQAGLALTGIVTEANDLAPVSMVTIECSADSLDDLLYDWIDALIFEMSTRNLLFGTFELEIDDGFLKARVWGEPVDRVRHSPAVEVKGPTYTELWAGWDDSSSEWVAQCVVDV